MKLSDVFEIKNGLSSNNVKISSTRTDDFNLAYIRPSSVYTNLIAGYVEGSAVSEKYIYPPESIIVSTDGDGSHTYSYVCPFPFVPNSNVAVLIPKRDMSLNEKIWYALCITKNRYKFSYGRKPKGSRLANVEIPVSIPKNLSEISLTEDKNISRSLKNEKYNLADHSWNSFKLKELFTLKKGKRLTKKEMKPGTTPFIGSSEQQNGITAFINKEPIHKSNTITVTYNGSVAEAFYQPQDFWASDDVNVLYPKFNLNKYIAQFLITLIRKEKYRFNYGRKWHTERMNESEIRLPVKSDQAPDWEFMENYIKSLAYSAGI